MERTHQIVNDQGLHIPLPLIEEYGFRPGEEVIVEMGADGIRITSAAPSQTEIEDKTLKLLMRHLGDAVVVKASWTEDGPLHAWVVVVSPRGHTAQLGEIVFSKRGDLITNLDEALYQMRRKATQLAAASK